MRWLVVVGLAGCAASQPDAGDGGAQAQVGAEFIAVRGCPSCHTASKSQPMAGDDAPLAGTAAYASNLTPDRATGIGEWADEAIVRAIRYGVGPDGVELCPAMPRYPTIGDVEAAAMVAYLRSLPAVTRAIPPSMCPPIKPPPPIDMAMPHD